MAAFTAAAIAGAAVVGGSVIQSNAAKKAAKGQQRAADQNIALQKEIYGKNEANLTPFIKSGTLANDAIADFLGLNGDVGQSQAFENYANSTGAEYTMRRGTDAITGSAATRGMLNSGATLKAVNQFARDDSQRYVNSYLSQLSGLSAQGGSAANSLAGVSQNFANNVNNQTSNAADAQGNAALAQGNIFANMLSQLAGTAGYFGGQSSYGGGHSGGATSLSALGRN